jgi:hypothetical protein
VPRIRDAVTVILTIAVPAGLAGCGGHSATRKDVVTQANAICAGALRDVRATPPPSSTALSAQVPYLARVAGIVAHESADLTKLPRPTSQRPVLTQWLTAERQVARDYAALVAAARGGDRASATEALSAIAANPAPTLAGRYGAVQCAAAAGTAVP